MSGPFSLSQHHPVLAAVSFLCLSTNPEIWSSDRLTRPGQGPSSVFFHPPSCAMQLNPEAVMNTDRISLQTSLAVFCQRFLFLVLALPYSSLSQTVQENLYVTNGTVRTVLVSGNTIYIGGGFTMVGPNTGSGAALDTASGTYDVAFPKVNGTIIVVIRDSAGGWYIGGNFTSVSGVVRNHIARIQSDKTLDETWDPDANGTVYSLYFSGSTVYAGGDFTFLGGLARNRIAALDASTGLATSWNPGANSTVNAFALSGSTLYTGGSFTTIGGQPRNRIAALDTSTGLATAWNSNASSAVFALALSGSTVYAGGSFTTIGGQTRNYIAALDTSTGLATSWNPDASEFVRTLALSGSTVYAGVLHPSADKRAITLLRSMQRQGTRRAGIPMQMKLFVPLSSPGQRCMQ